MNTTETVAEITERIAAKVGLAGKNGKLRLEDRVVTGIGPGQFVTLSEVPFDYLTKDPGASNLEIYRTTEWVEVSPEDWTSLLDAEDNEFGDSDEFYEGPDTYLGDDAE